jgi:hypothetical protein
MKESLILGAGSGALAGAAAGLTVPGDQTENALAGAVIGGVIGGLTSYLIHGSLQSRDESVRRDTLMNLEHYEVLGVQEMKEKSSSGANKKCLTTHVVDGRLVSIPCEFAPNYNESFN